MQIVGLLADKGVPKIFSTLLCDEGGLLWMGGYNPTATTSTPLFTPLDNTQAGSRLNICLSLWFAFAQARHALAAGLSAR